MRIISGTLKGRSLSVPKNFKGRPTTDFAREGLFNVLQNVMDMEGAQVLDLFAGTGSFSIECFSRGAASLLCVEMNAQHARFIRDNFRHFEIHHADVLLTDALKFINHSHEKFDIVFADPPYDLPALPVLPDMILKKQMLKEDGILVLEHGNKINFEEHPAFMQHRKYSNVHFSFFRTSPS
ncbi:MAG: 16S rRNA (guanine(966)-N(2))-methyltransferase RsmD [Flavobacteriales bacterium]